jgi:Zn-finger nucleic acid-binding protein
MKLSLKSLFLAVVCLGAPALTSCTTVHAPHPAVASNAVMCDRCKTTWVTGVESGGRVTRYTRQKAMVCPDCTSAVQNWMRTGILKHHCSHCGGTMSCEPPQAQ